jgi:tetratricopeptide (TPR) repeat protein
MAIFRLSIALLVSSISGHAWSADGANAANLRKEACIAAINERTAALVARDWQSLERFSENYVRSCKSVFSAEDFSDAYERIADANIAMANPKKALAAAETCIAVFYGKTGCHLNRALALIGLKRRPEARTALDRAERLIAHRAETAKRELRTLGQGQEKELAESQIYMLEAQQSLATSIRGKYFPE